MGVAYTYPLIGTTVPVEPDNMPIDVAVVQVGNSVSIRSVLDDVNARRNPLSCDGGHTWNSVGANRCVCLEWPMGLALQGNENSWPLYEAREEMFTCISACALISSASIPPACNLHALPSADLSFALTTTSEIWKPCMTTSVEDPMDEDLALGTALVRWWMGRMEITSIVSFYVHARICHRSN